jgi:DNA-directed RNA polymerase subunit RPC12/RpoP
MKCIHCSTDNKYTDRSTTHRCKACGHPFAFEPKTDPFQMNDPMFARAIKDVSADDTLFFTPRQMWYEVNRRLLKRPTLGCGSAVLIFLIGGSVVTQVHYGAPLLIGVPGVAMAATAVKLKSKTKSKKPRVPKMAWATFETNYLRKWTETHGAPAKMLTPPPAVRPTEPMPPWSQHAAPDVTAYSFDRALIVQNAEIAALLVANNFHFENNCAILSLDGYPFGAADTIKTMLARNPALKVFALHDATIEGTQMGKTLRQSDWFPDTSIPLIDLGLRPLHAIDGDLIIQNGMPRSFPVGVASTSLKAEEIQWLEQGNTAELHTVRPHKLMRAIYQGFARAGQLDNAEVGPDGFLIVDTGPYPSYWVHDGGADFYAADSFG